MWNAIAARDLDPFGAAPIAIAFFRGLDFLDELIEGLIEILLDAFEISIFSPRCVDVVSWIRSIQAKRSKRAIHRKVPMWSVIATRDLDIISWLSIAIEL